LPTVPPATSLLDLATRAARRAADYLRSVDRPTDPTRWNAKGRNDFATACDRRAEELIAEVLLGEEPGSRMVGEELTPTLERGGLVWITDPIDGTTNFVHGFPFYAVSVAATVDGVLEAGVVLHVEPDRLYAAWRGGGAWLLEGSQVADRKPGVGSPGGRRLRVSAIRDPGHALVGTGFPFKHLDRLDAYQAQFATITRATSGVRRAGSAALDLTWIAAGQFDGFWELQLAPWDIAAGILLVREAGGVVTDLAGRSVGAEHTAVVAGNPAIHGWLLQVLGGG
jgi:myo-inositol-1(or 4)-monophosphatase